MRELGVGELLRAWHALGARDEATRAAIRDLLLPEFGWSPREEPGKEARPPAPTLTEPLPPFAPLAAETPAPSSAQPPGDAPAEPDAPRELQFFAEPDTSEPRPLQVPMRGPALPADRRLPPEPEPLLDVEWSRRIVGGLMATEAPLGDVDVARLTRKLVEMRELRHLPRKRQPTLRLGAQVLLDRHPSMMVFYSDQSALRREIEGVAGRERTTILRCDRVPPGRVSDLTSSRWRDYAPPPPRTPVLLVSDLGMARGAFPLNSTAEEEWTAFLAPLRSAGCPVSALVPCALDRYPAFVHERIRLLLWDDTTRPSDARRVRRAHR